MLEAIRQRGDVQFISSAALLEELADVLGPRRGFQGVKELSTQISGPGEANDCTSPHGSRCGVTCSGGSLLR
ncbi:MAG: hypothetical protein ACK5RP_13195, partial [Betaproteobacteria bacterium]